MSRSFRIAVAWLLATEACFAAMRVAARGGAVASDLPWAEIGAFRFLGGAVVPFAAARLRGESLRLGFSFLGVTRLQKNSRITARTVWPVKIGGDKKARQTLKDDLLDNAGLSFQTARNSGIQRTVVVWQATQDLNQCFTDIFLSPLGISNRADCRYFALSLLELLLRNLVHPAEKWVFDLPFRWQD